MDQKTAMLAKLLPEPYSSALGLALASGAIKMEVKFYNLAFYWGNGQVVAGNMPLSTPTIMNMTSDDPGLNASKMEMMKLYKELVQEYNKSGVDNATLPTVQKADYLEALGATPYMTAMPAPKKPEFPSFHGTPPDEEVKIPMTVSMGAVTSSSDTPASTAAKKLESAMKIMASAKKAAFVSTATPIKLKDATNLGQRVKGTSPDSKYFLIAKSEFLRIAMRNQYSQGNVSFRVEFLPNTPPAQLAKLKMGGMNLSNSLGVMYASLHLGTTNQDGDVLPLGRIVGSFLMGLGIELDAMIINPNDIPEDA